MKKTMIAVTTLFLVTVAAQAQFQPTGEEYKLQQTRSGYAVNASGVVSIWSSLDGSTNFAVRANAEFPDGTVLMVSCTDRDGRTADVGTLEMRLGSGMLRLNSRRNENSPAFPTDRIARVDVSRRNDVLLIGRLVRVDSDPN